MGVGLVLVLWGALCECAVNGDLTNIGGSCGEKDSSEKPRMPDKTVAWQPTQGLATVTNRDNRNEDRAEQEDKRVARRNEAGTTDKSATVTNRNTSRSTGNDAESPKMPEGSLEGAGIDMGQYTEGSRFGPQTFGPGDNRDGGNAALLNGGFASKPPSFTPPGVPFFSLNVR